MLRSVLSVYDLSFSRAGINGAERRPVSVSPALEISSGKLQLLVGHLGGRMADAFTLSATLAPRTDTITNHAAIHAAFHVLCFALYTSPALCNLPPLASLPPL